MENSLLVFSLPDKDFIENFSVEFEGYSYV